MARLCIASRSQNELAGRVFLDHFSNLALWNALNIEKIWWNFFLIKNFCPISFLHGNIISLSEFWSEYFKISKIICFNFFRGISILNTKTELERFHFFMEIFIDLSEFWSELFKNSKIICFNFFFRGISVLNTKTELERAMEKRSRHSKEKQRQVEKEDEKTPFQKMLDDRARRLEMLVRIIVLLFRKLFWPILRTEI